PVTTPRVLIIAPTRELVVQIEADAKLLGQHTPFKILAVYGGIDYNRQRDALAEACDVLVGTPGRLIDYLKQHVWSPRRVEVLVIDEADRMFDMGFIADLRFILRRLPPPEKRQSFLFSATLSFRVLELTWEFMNNPTQITIMPQQKTAERVEQLLYHVGREEKFGLLLGLLRREGGDRILIFANTREEAGRRRRQGHRAGGRGQRAEPRGHREVHRPEDPGGVAGGRPDRARDQADRGGAPPLLGRAARALRGAARPRGPLRRRPPGRPRPR